MKNKIWKNVKMLFSITLVIGLVLCYVIPFINVFAEGEKVLTFEVEDSSKFSLSVSSGRVVITSLNTNDSNPNSFIDIMNGNNDESNNTVVSCSSSTRCTVTVPSNFNNVKLRFPPNKFDLTYNDGQNEVLINEDTVFSSSTTIDIKEALNQSGSSSGQFDGRAYVVWSCDGGVCYHYFDNIPVDENGTSTFYRTEDVDATNNPGEEFDVNARYKGWILPDNFDRWKLIYQRKAYATKTGQNFEDINWDAAVLDEIDWTSVDPKDILENYPDMGKWEERAVDDNVCQEPPQNQDRSSFERCVDGYADAHGVLPNVVLRPLPDEPFDNNAYVSYGDRKFKVVIYNSNYKGVSIGSLDQLHYYPASWNDPFIRTDQFDVSGTTKDDPAVITMPMLETTINIKNLTYNGFNITSMEALDVSDDGVIVTKNGNEFNIEFKSNYFDKVVFKVIDSNGGVSYLRVERFTLKAELMHDNNGESISGHLFYDKNDTYTHYIVKAKLLYKDGTTKQVLLNAVKGVDDGLGNIEDTYERDESNPEYCAIINGQRMVGKGLKQTSYKYNLSNDERNKLSKVYLTVEYTGSTDNTYAGAFAGSGKGIVFEVGGRS